MKSIDQLTDAEHARRIAIEQQLGDKTKAPPRFKDEEDWTPADHDRHLQTGEKPESPEYRAYLREVHERAGLEAPEKTYDEKVLDGDEITVEDEVNRTRRQK